MNYPMQNTEFTRAWHQSDYVRDTKIIRVTPEIAKDLLEKNFQNRKIKPSLVQRIMAEILKGRWEVTHQAIAIDEDNNLIDGQHRLTAIYKSGLTVNVRVTLNCKRKTINVVDTGKSRSNADMLVMDKIPNANHTAASVRQLICYQKHKTQFWNDTSIIITALDVKEKIKELHQSDIDVHEAVLAGTGYSKKFKPLIASITTTFILLASISDTHQYLVNDFLEKLSTGVALEDDSPLQVLRRRWINATVKQYPHRMISQIKLAEMIHIFNIFIRNQTITRMPTVSLTPMPFFE